MNTRQLTYIIAIAEKESLSGAAAELNISQPALSKYLADLEKELNTELFLRHKKKLLLTAAGRIYVDAAKKIVSVKEQTYQTISSLSREYKGTITVGATPLRGSIAIARIFPIFCKRYPNINIAIKESYMAGLRQAVIEQSVDIALGTCIDLDSPDILHISACEEDLVLGVPVFHHLAPTASRDLDHLTTVDIREFKDSPFLMGGRGSTIRTLADSIFKQTHMNPTIVYESNNNLVLLNMIQSGAGVCLLPKSAMKPSDHIVYFSIRPRYFLNLSIMFPKNHVLSEEERYLTALVLASDCNHPRYRLNPTPMAKQIMDEFPMPEFTDEFPFTL